MQMATLFSQVAKAGCVPLLSPPSPTSSVSLSTSFFLYVSQAPSFPSFSSSHFLLPSPSEGRPEKVGPSSSVPVNTSAFLLNMRFQFPGCMQAARPFRPEGLKCQDQSCMENPFFLRATLPASCSRSAPAWLTCGKPLSKITEWIILEISNFVSLK